MSTLPSDAPRPRFCHVKKSYPEQEYGFDLHAEKVKGQFIGNVDADSPAGLAGLRKGDRIVAVNGVSIIQENHKEVVKRIKEDPLQCRLVVLEEEGFEWYNERKLTIPIEGDFVINAAVGAVAHVPNLPPPDYEDAVESTKVIQSETRTENFVEEHRHHSMENQFQEMHDPAPPSFHVEVAPHGNGQAFKPRPRLCRLVKTSSSDEFGFNLHAEKGKGHFIGKVDPESIAEIAGLEEGQRIVGVNKTLIYPHTAHKEVVALIKQDPAHAELLVAFPEIDNWYRTKDVEYSFDDAETVQFDHQRARTTSYGRTVEQKNGHAVHVEKELSKTYDNLNEDVSHVSASTTSSSVHDHHPTPTKHNEVVETHQDHVVESHRSPIAEPIRYEKPSPISAPKERSQPTPNGAPDLFRLSAAEMRASLHKKTDPRKENQNMSLREKYEIIQNL